MAVGNLRIDLRLTYSSAATNDRSPRVRGTAAWALGQLDDNGAKAPPGLLRLLPTRTRTHVSKRPGAANRRFWRTAPVRYALHMRRTRVSARTDKGADEIG